MFFLLLHWYVLLMSLYVLESTYEFDACHSIHSLKCVLCSFFLRIVEFDCQCMWIMHCISFSLFYVCCVDVSCVRFVIAACWLSAGCVCWRAEPNHRLFFRCISLFHRSSCLSSLRISPPPQPSHRSLVHTVILHLLLFPSVVRFTAFVTSSLSHLTVLFSVVLRSTCRSVMLLHLWVFILHIYPNKQKITQK